MVPSRAHIVNVLILLTLVGGSILVFDSLPDRIPRHAGLTGDFDAYWAKTWVNWLLVPSIAVFLSAMMYGFAWLISQSLDGINTPNQKTYDALPTQDKRQVVAIVQRFLYWTAAATGILVSSIHWAFYAAMMDGGESVGAWPLPVTLVFTAALVAMAVITGKRMGLKAGMLAREST